MFKFRDLTSVLNITVIIAGLGYFVDLFDITLYGVVRVTSLRSLGITSPQQILSDGLYIYNMQMAGMIVGGILWGRLADKRGRLSVLFASILLYSIANLANVFVNSVNAYATCRFVGGLGLAGELGAAVTLVAESLPIEKRGLGTTVVATLGMLGILAAAFFGQLLSNLYSSQYSWRIAYGCGAGLGFLLLFARFKITESRLFINGLNNGNLILILQKGRLRKYFSCIAVGVPIYFATGVLFTFAPELSAGLGVKDDVSAGSAILFGSLGLALGDLFSGLFSQWLRSRKRAVGALLLAGFGLLLLYCFCAALTSTTIYILSLAMGLTLGYWAVLVTMAAEQFGTNMRGTVSTTVPNFVRGSGVLATSGFALLKAQMSAAHSALIVGSICFGFAFLGLTQLDETFARNLDFDEN